MSFERILNHMCWPCGAVYRLRYDYESFPHPLDDLKHVCIVMKTRKNLDEKKKFIEISDSNLTFFRSLWRSPRPSCCLLRVCNWLKYDYGNFSQSLGDSKHVRNGLKNIKNFCWKKSFHRNFWPKFEISHGGWRSQYEKSSLRANFECQNKFETLNQKSASTVLSGLIWRTN